MNHNWLGGIEFVACDNGGLILFVEDNETRRFYFKEKGDLLDGIMAAVAKRVEERFERLLLDNAKPVSRGEGLSAEQTASEASKPQEVNFYEVQPGTRWQIKSLEGAWIYKGRATGTDFFHFKKEEANDCVSVRSEHLRTAILLAP